MAARFLPFAQKVARFAMNRQGMTSRYVDVAGARLHVYDGRGRGALPPTVLLHGLGSAGAAFARVAARMRRHASRVVVPELPGHGFSARGASPITPDVLLESVAGAVGEVLDQPAIVVGNSLGGAIAIKYALEHPDRVRALLLVSPAGAPLVDAEWQDLVSKFDVPDRREALVFLQRLYHRPPWFLPLLAREFPHLLANPAVREILASVTPADAPLPEELASLRMPILFLWGRSEKLLPRSALAYFRENLPPHAVIEEPEGYGHTPHSEVPEHLADRLVGFMRDVAGSRL